MAKKSTQVVSFLGGLVFVGIVVGVTVALNKKLREELSSQARSLVETGKSVVEQVQFVTGRVQRVAEGLEGLKKDSAAEQASANILEAQNYSDKWAEIETAIKRRQESEQPANDDLRVDV
ncbi:MAG: hypothetical protein FWF30_01585 [Coriobacteriia bacterium]|nr:hypothetical protein [Coriobacteriia bacterium]